MCLLVDYVVSVMLLYVVKYIVEGFDVFVVELFEVVLWLFVNLFIDGFLFEYDDMLLVWDNVVYCGIGLGYVVVNY